LHGLQRIALARGDTTIAGKLDLAIERHRRRRRPDRPAGGAGREHEQ
jgi:hypothetical protein